MYLSPLQIRDAAIEKAIESIQAHERRESRRAACLEGVDMCRVLETPTDFEDAIRSRQEWERSVTDDMLADTKEFELYWNHCSSTEQIVWIFEIMKVAWDMPPFSVRAVLAVGMIRNSASESSFD